MNITNNDILYLIADMSHGIEPIEEALKEGIDLLQLREKQLSSREYLKRAKVLRELTRKYKTKFIINDRLDIAMLSDADGVHLGQDDIRVQDARNILGSNKIIGATCKTREQAVIAYEEGADYIGSGAWFATSTKSDAILITPEGFECVVNASPLPVYAIGGITVENASEPLLHHAFGLAVSSGIMKAENIREAVYKLRKQMEKRNNI